jgi:TDG/mug DNA glycosylase family protein
MGVPSPPTPDELARAVRKSLRDVVRPGLKVVFCGINPSLYSAAAGHHFARPGNRFYGALHRAGFTPRLYFPWEDRSLLKLGCGITNLVDAATARADELSGLELMAGGARLKRRLTRLRPRFLAVLGIGAYRKAFGSPKAAFGLQEETLGRTHVWVLPNPSGLNARFSLADLAELFRELRRFVVSGQLPAKASSARREP